METTRLLSQTKEQSSVIVSKKLNSFRRINKFLEATNESLPDGGLLIGTAETEEGRKRILYKRLLFPLNLFVYIIYFATYRLFPKINRFSASVYFYLTGGKNRALSRAEILGRLCSCGFKIENFSEKDGLLSFVAKKTGKPKYNMQPSYWPVFKMNRVGKGGDIIGVYKLRTMHPYSEYLQEFLMEKNGLDEGGKFKRDFRVTGWGRWLRKYWIDELPMIANLIKGDIKLVGVRPLSQHYFNLYDEELKMLRLLTKPGLVPPFYADMPKTLEEIIESEKKYLNSYYKAPLYTDVKYFFKGMYNICFKKARSK